MNDAVFRIRSSSGHGTGFLISRSLALTAAHCIRGATELQFESEAATVGAKVMVAETTLDTALLTLNDPNALDGAIRPVRIGTLPDDRPLADFRWNASGFAVGDLEELGLELTGSLAGIQSMGEIRRLQLNCDQFGADSGGIAGSSGSPVTVNRFAVALVSRAPKSFKQRIVFATLLEDVLPAFRPRVEARYRDEFEALLADVVAIELDDCDRALNRYVGGVKRLGRSFHERGVRTPACSTRQIERACLDATFVPIRLQQVREAHELWVDPQDVGCATTSMAPLERPVCVEGAIQSALSSSSRLQMLLTGYAGTGKTTLLSHLASQALSAPESIGLRSHMAPLLLSLPELARARCSSNLSDWLVEARVRGAVACELPSADWGFVMEFPLRLHAPLLLLFDGLDEVPDQLRRDLWRSFRLCVVEGGYSWVMASRPATSHEDPVNDISQRPGVHTYKIQPWSDSELNQFATSMLGVERAGSFLKEFRLISMGRTTMTPLLALIGMCVYGDSQSGLPRTRAELFELFVDNAIVRGNERHGNDGVNRDERGELMAMLAKVALYGTKRPEPLTLDDVWRFLVPGGPGVSTVAPTSLKDAFGRAGLHSGLLTVDKEERVVWWHASVREYLTARALADGPEDERLRILKLYNEPQWLEIIVMMLLILSVRHHRRPDRNPDVTKYFDKLSMESDAGLVLYFALADGAAVDSCTQSLVIGSLVAGAIRLGQESECREFNEELALQGRSPIQLLMKLRRISLAVNGIAEIRDDPRVLPWMREEARAALARG